MSIEQILEVWNHDVDRASQTVAIALANYADPFGQHIRPSIARIAWATGYSARQVQRIMSRLKRSGILREVRPATPTAPAEYALDWTSAKQKPPFDPAAHDCPGRLRVDTIAENNRTCQGCAKRGTPTRGPDRRAWEIVRTNPDLPYRPDNIRLLCSACARGDILTPLDATPSHKKHESGLQMSPYPVKGVLSCKDSLDSSPAAAGERIETGQGTATTSNAPDSLFSAVAKVCAVDIRSAAEARKVGKVARDLKVLGITAEDVKEFGRRWWLIPGRIFAPSVWQLSGGIGNVTGPNRTAPPSPVAPRAARQGVPRRGYAPNTPDEETEARRFLEDG